MCDINSRARLVCRCVLVVDATSFHRLTRFPALPQHPGIFPLTENPVASNNVLFQNFRYMTLPLRRVLVQRGARQPLAPITTSFLKLSLSNIFQKRAVKQRFVSLRTLQLSTGLAKRTSGSAFLMTPPSTASCVHIRFPVPLIGFQSRANHPVLGQGPYSCLFVFLPLMYLCTSHKPTCDINR